MQDPTVWKVTKLCFLESRILAVVLFRISQYLRSKKIAWRFAPYLKRICEILTRFECHLKARIDQGLHLSHTQKSVIGEGVKIGKNVTLFNGITLGSVAMSSRLGDNRCPELLDGASAYTGAKILGPIVVGKGSVIGANSVVVQKVPDGCVAAGVPARIINSNKRS